MSRRMRTYYMQSYAPPGRPFPWLRLGAVALVLLIVVLPMVSRHRPRGSGEGPLAAAPASSTARPGGPAGGSQGSEAVARSVTKAIQANDALEPAPIPAGAPAASGAGGHPPVVGGGVGGRYHVQVGPPVDKAAAAELARQLRALGYAVKIVGAKPYLVWVGGYLDAPTAERLISRLRGQGFNAVLSNRR